jgi:acyl dehydratase
MTRYFDDFKVGDVHETGGVTLTEAAIVDFAERYDPQPFHIDAEAAKASPFGGLIASGFHTLAVCFRRVIDAKIVTPEASLGSPGIDAIRWLRPVRPGDTLKMRGEVLEVKPSSSRPDRGIVRVKYTAINQAGEAVMTLDGMHLLRRRPEA